MQQKYLKLEEASDSPTGGSGAPPSETPPITTAVAATAAAEGQPSPAAPDAAEPAAAEAPGSDGIARDEFGYKIADKPGTKDQKAGAKEAPPEKLEDLKDPGTGYGVKPVEAPEEEVAAPPAKAADVIDPNAPPPLEVDLKGLDEGSAKTLKQFMETQKLTKEQAQSLADLVKASSAEAQKAQAAAVKAQKAEENKIKAQWDKNLRDDPVFGKENFNQSVHKAEKVLKDFFPNTKKELTSRQTMLPDYVMRDLAKLSDHLFGGDKFVAGDASGRSAPEKKEPSPLDFYG